MDYAYIIPIITAVTEGVKRIGLPSKYAWLIAAGLGLGYGLVVSLSVESALMGLAHGLAASGLYEGLDGGFKAISSLRSRE